MKKILLIFLILVSQIILAQSSSDCGGNVQVCGNTPISYTPNGSGDVLEILGGCLNNEHYSIWYTFTAAATGTLTFMISPNTPNDDYDWAVYGPNSSCSNLGTPIRCNYSGTRGDTGLTMTATNTSSTASQSPFCSYLDVMIGETYYVIVDNFSTSANGFVLTWGGSATLVSPFNDAYQPFPFLEPGQPGATDNAPREIVICKDPTLFDFSTLTANIINNNPNFTASYYNSSNDLITGQNPITTPINVNTTDIYYYAITYSIPGTPPGTPPGAIEKCRIPGKFKFINKGFTVNNVTITECNNNNAGNAVFNLTIPNIISDSTATKKYYPSMYDLNNNINEITNPYQYTSAGSKVYVLVTSTFGCSAIATITLNLYPVVETKKATLKSCFLEANFATALFNLTDAQVTSAPGVTKEYYPSKTDAINQTNSIQNPNSYIAPNGIIYIRVSNNRRCYSIAEVTLEVIPPAYSSLLEDKIICMEDKIVLDAGPGFDGYEWSTGATTQTINKATVGTYWVKLKSGECISLQKVKIYPAEQPVISSIEMTANTITVHAVGGKIPYKYSIDNNNWQDSNIFNNVTRGDNTVYIKDAYDCNPIEAKIIVPNIINIITPNGDGINDYIDYSALSNKHNLTFSVFDRYGSKIYQADQSNGYKWDGTINGKDKLSTGNYWYSLTWNENNKKSTPFQFSGWVMVKNRD